MSNNARAILNLVIVWFLLALSKAQSAAVQPDIPENFQAGTTETTPALSGTWSGSDQTTGGEIYYSTLQLAQSNNEFGGTHVWSNGPIGTITGTVSGLTVVWTRIDAASSYRAYLSGTLSFDYQTMSGTWSDTNGVSGTWQATKSHSTHVVSDATIKYAETLVPGWQTLAFDDSAWLTVVAPSTGLCTPFWGELIPNSAALPTWGQNPQQYQTIYARKTFTVQTPVSATIQTIVDDDFDLYVNGVLVRSDWDGWEDGIHQDDISSLIQAGVNVIAFKASDTSGGCQKLVFDVTLGQGGSYSVFGVVRNDSNDAIAGVAVSAGPDGSATTDASGYYTITNLITGTYTLTPSKSGYTFSPPSRTVSVPPDAAGQDFVGSNVDWTVMVYLDGDNNLDLNYVDIFNQLESAANNSSANVIVAWDRLGSNNSAYYKVKYDTNPNQLATYTEGVDKWAKGELNMGSPNTLSDFVLWARAHYPARHYALLISNHGTGLNGTARDETNGNDWMTLQELGNALSTATSNGNNKLDVIFADSCLMAMIEDAYQIRSYANFYVGSENLLWITGNPSVGPYDNYISSIGSFTTPFDLASALVTQYKAWLDSAYPSLPYTISAVDLGRINNVVAAIRDLAVNLNSQMNTYGTQIAAARAEVQKFDSTNNFRIEANDQYVDLYDLAEKISVHITDPTIRAQAQVVTSTLSTYVIRNEYKSGEYTGPETNQQTVYWDLDHSHGVSIFFPPNRSSFYDVSRYDFAEGAIWSSGQQTASAFIQAGEVQWAPMLVNFFQTTQPGGPDTPNPPDLVAPLSPNQKLYLPLILRSP